MDKQPKINKFKKGKKEILKIYIYTRKQNTYRERGRDIEGYRRGWGRGQAMRSLRMTDIEK